MKAFTGTRAYQWVHHQCEKQLSLWLAGAEEKGANLLLRMFFERGNQLEAKYLADVRHTAGAVVDIRERHRNERAAATIEAMRSGADVILHPEFRDAESFGLDALDLFLRGEGDVLRLVPGPLTSTGLHRYRLIEVKSSAAVEIHHTAQAAFYALLLGKLLGEAVGTATIVTWRQDGDALVPVDNEVDLAKMHDELRHFFTEDLPRIARDPAPDFHLRSTCSSCAYRDACHEDGLREEHLSILPGLRRRQRAELNNVGIHRWTQLAVSANDFEAIENRWQGPRTGLRATRRQALALKLDACFPSGELDEEIVESPSWQLASGAPSIPGARVYLDLETDAVDRRVYLLGYMAELSRTVPASRLRRMSEHERFAATLVLGSTPDGGHRPGSRPRS